MAPRAGEIVVAALIGLAAAGVGFVVNARAWQLRRVGEHGRCPSVSWLRHSQQAMRVTDLIANETRAVARLRWRFIEPDQGNVTERETIEIVRLQCGQAVEHWGTEACSSQLHRTETEKFLDCGWTL